VAASAMDRLSVFLAKIGLAGFFVLVGQLANNGWLFAVLYISHRVSGFHFQCGIRTWTGLLQLSDQ